MPQIMQIINARELKEKVSLVDLLSKLGFQPAKRTGNELLYFSMLRDSDSKPSFSVNDRLGVWFDHGLGKGGNVIDFGIAFWHLPFQETLEKIAGVCAAQLPMVTAEPNRARQRSVVKIPNYRVEEIKALGHNPAIAVYLQQRGVWQAAQGRLKEVHYYVEDQKKQRKYFSTAGWQNELAAWEIRSEQFQGCLGHKAISFIPGDKNSLAMFEGYLDYLSWLTDYPLATNSIIVLNSVNTLPAAITKANGFEDVFVYFDHDPAGYNATKQLLQALTQARDASAIYEGYNDYNDKLVATQQQHYLTR
jgi:hypothetical protein